MKDLCGAIRIIPGTRYRESYGSRGA